MSMQPCMRSRGQAEASETFLATSLSTPLIRSAPPTTAPHEFGPDAPTGGQIVPTSTNEEELCINGMSFRWVV